jgi:hypothetical protein
MSSTGAALSLKKTLINLVKEQILYVPSRPRKSKSERGIGRPPSLLPPRFKEIVARRET